MHHPFTTRLPAGSRQYWCARHSYHFRRAALYFLWTRVTAARGNKAVWGFLASPPEPFNGRQLIDNGIDESFCKEGSEATRFVTRWREGTHYAGRLRHLNSLTLRRNIFKQGYLKLF